jgi:hypothetical protein
MENNWQDDSSDEEMEEESAHVFKSECRCGYYSSIKPEGTCSGGSDIKEDVAA